jgi:hypothetical protein
MAPLKFAGSYKDVFKFNFELPVNEEQYLPTKFWWLVTAALVAASAYVGYRVGRRNRTD